MQQQKLTILYERLSREDERENESLSIEHQKAYLEEYAIRNHCEPFIHLTDDGWSGTRWDRPGFLKMMEEVRKGTVCQICTKDMSRVGRDHLRVGLFLEELREQHVRLVAVAEGIDTAKGEDDFMPFRNLIAEWHARDTSKKIRAIFEARKAHGKHVTGSVPYGYLHDPTDRQKWIVDEEAAVIVKRLFHGIIMGKTVAMLSRELTEEQVLIPTAHWTKVNAGMRSCPNAHPTKWAEATILQILRKEEYMGWTVLNKTIKETYKSKRRKATPEERLIFKDAHPAIVDEETWHLVQKLRETRRIPERIGGDPNPLTGILYCADCGQKMFHKQGRSDTSHLPHNEYYCSSYRHYSRHCTCHYIRVSVVQELILHTIQRVSKFALENESLFVERLRAEANLQQETAMKESRKKLAKIKRKLEDVGGYVKKLYESYAVGKIPEKHFTDLLADYDREQETLQKEMERLNADVEQYNTDSIRADRFIELVKRYTTFDTFSTTLLNEFVDKVVVHEAVKINGRRTQQVDIYLSFIGRFDIPEWAENEALPLPTPHKKRKKRRHEMTEEQRNRERERDHIRYAQKVAGKKKAEAERRLAILKGSAYEHCALGTSNNADDSTEGDMIHEIAL